MFGYMLVYMLVTVCFILKLFLLFNILSLRFLKSFYEKIKKIYIYIKSLSLSLLWVALETDLTVAGICSRSSPSSSDDLRLFDWFNLQGSRQTRSSYSGLGIVGKKKNARYLSSKCKSFYHVRKQELGPVHRSGPAMQMIVAKTDGSRDHLVRVTFRNIQVLSQVLTP